jgi:hypothetical protein
MKRISAERKEAVIKKMLPPLSMSVHELMEIEGILGDQSAAPQSFLRMLG